MREELHGARLCAGVRSAGMRERRAVLVDVLGRVRVEAVRVIDDDLAGDRGDRIVVAEHGALDLARPVDAALDDAPWCRTRRRGRSPRRAPRALRARRTPTDEPRFAGLTNSGIAERLAALERPRARSRSHVGARAASRHGTIGMLGGGEEALHHVLVHAHGGAEHARADVGHARELEQALHRAVLAHRAVQHREDDVDRRPLARALADRASAASPPRRGCAASATSGMAWLSRARRGSRAAPRRSASSWRSQRPLLSMPTRTGSKRSRSSDSTTKRAERSEISCSAERPPKTTATRSFCLPLMRAEFYRFRGRAQRNRVFEGAATYPATYPPSPALAPPPSLLDAPASPGRQLWGMQILVDPGEHTAPAPHWSSLVHVVLQKSAKAAVE